MLDWLEGALVVDSDSGLLTHDVGVHRSKIGSSGTLVVVLSDAHLEVVVELSGVDLESRLVSLVGDTVSNLGAEHHLGALHEVVHDVLEPGHASLLVDHVEVDLLVCHDLDSNVASNEVDLAPHVVELVVLLPQASLWVDLEEEDGA